MAGFVTDIIKCTGNSYASLASDGIQSGDISGFTDTGSFYLNSLISASMFKGLPNGKVTALAGPSGTGKTYILLSIIKEFLKENPEGVVVLFESESALTKEMIEDRGIDTNRLIIIPVITVQEFRNQAVRILDQYLGMKETNRPPMFLALDSLGMLSTTKEIEDAQSGSDKKDMTRAQLIRSVFRVITLKLGRAGVPMVLTNHTYSQMSQYAGIKMSGGDGIVYAASTIIFLSKSKDKDEKKNVIGAIIRCKVDKGRLTMEQSEALIYINFKTGLHRYFGLIQVAIDAGIWEKLHGGVVRINTMSPTFEEIMADKSKWITEDTYKRINKTISLKELGSIIGLWEADGNKITSLSGEKIFVSKVKSNPEYYFTNDVWDNALTNADVQKLFNDNNIFSVEVAPKEIGRHPESYFTKKVLKELDTHLYNCFAYGASNNETEEEEELNE